MQKYYSWLVISFFIFSVYMIGMLEVQKNCKSKSENRRSALPSPDRKYAAGNGDSCLTMDTVHAAHALAGGTCVLHLPCQGEILPAELRNTSE